MEKEQKGGIFQKIKGESGKLTKAVRHQSFTYIVEGLGLVAGLAWNEAIKSLIEFLFPAKQNDVLAKFVYAFLITVAVVFITSYLGRLLKEKEE